MSIINGQILLLGAALVAALWVARNSRRARLAEAKAAHPATRSKKCDMAGCNGPRIWGVTRHRDNKRAVVCGDCYHEGNAYGIWR